MPSLNTIATTVNDLGFWTRTECVCLHRQGLGHSGVTSHYYRTDHSGLHAEGGGGALWASGLGQSVCVYTGKVWDILELHLTITELTIQGYMQRGEGGRSGISIPAKVPPPFSVQLLW